MRSRFVGLDLNYLRSSLAAAVVVGVGLSPAYSQEGSRLVIAAPADVISWDPIAHVHSAAMPLYRSVFDSPLIQTPDLELKPNVVSAWRWLDKGLTLELSFRDDVIFHNGDQLTAEDFKFSYYDRLQAEGSLALAGVFGKSIKSIDVKSPTLAVIHFDTVMPLALDWMGSIGNFILPKNYFTKVGREEFLKKPIGSGPYKVVEYQQGTRVVLEAFDRYWNGKPKSQTLIFEIVKEPSARVAAIQSGRVDIATALPIREVTRLNSLPGLAGEINPITSAMLLQAHDVGSFKDKNVRLAAGAAIDRAALSKAFFGGKATIISVPGTPTMPGYDKTFELSYDPEKAKALLASSGYGPQKPAELTFYSTNGAQPNDWEIARAIVGMWSQVGIKANLEAVEVPKYFELNAAGKLPEAILWSWNAATNDPEQFTGNLLDPNSRFSVWKSADMGEKLGPLLKEFDYKTRIEGYTAVNRYAVEQGYVIPLLQGVNGIAYKKDLEFQWFTNGWFEPYRIGRKS